MRSGLQRLPRIPSLWDCRDYGHTFLKDWLWKLRGWPLYQKVTLHQIGAQPQSPAKIGQDEAEMLLKIA